MIGFRLRVLGVDSALHCLHAALRTDCELPRKALTVVRSGEAFPTAIAEEADFDRSFATRLQGFTGEASPEKAWLAALLLKRIALFGDSFESFHFTRNAQHTE